MPILAFPVAPGFNCSQAAAHSTSWKLKVRLRREHGSELPMEMQVLEDGQNVLSIDSYAAPHIQLNRQYVIYRL